MMVSLVHGSSLEFLPYLKQRTRPPVFAPAYLLGAYVLRSTSCGLNPAVDCLKSAGRICLAELVPVEGKSQGQEYGANFTLPQNHAP